MELPFVEGRVEPLCVLRDTSSLGRVFYGILVGFCAIKHREKEVRDNMAAVVIFDAGTLFFFGLRGGRSWQTRSFVGKPDYHGWI